MTGSARLVATLPGTRMPELDPRELDPVRARRLDRESRIATAMAARALATASRGPTLAPARAGVVLGSAFGSVDGSSAFMHRLFDKGPRLASPADFPNLVPSASVGHASIYLGRCGPALAVADLAASGEAALAQALELVQAGLADQMVAGSAEEASDIVERVLVALFAAEGAAARTEGAGMLVLEDEKTAREGGGTVLARVVAHAMTRTRGEHLRVPGPQNPSRARVVTAYADARLKTALAGTSWEGVATVELGPTAGDHEALGAVAACVAVELIAAGEVDEALVLCADPHRGYALVLARP